MSQNKKTCTKCNKLFTTEYHLHKHTNRSVPCDVVLSCNRCKKIFRSQRELTIHTNRKVICDIFVTKISDKITLLNIKVAAKEKLAREAAVREKIKAVAKEKLAHEIIKKNLIKLENKIKLVADLALQERDKIAARQKLQETKIAAAFKLQEMKNANKCITAKILNDRADAEKQRLALNKKAEDELEYEIMYKIAYKASKHTKNFFNRGMDDILHDLFGRGTQQNCIDIFTKAETCAEIVHTLLKQVLSNDNNKFLFYNSRISMFCAVTQEVINKVPHIIIIQKTYAQVFDALLPIIEYCYTRYNGGEVALYEYKCDSIRAQNEIANKFARFSDERKTFLDLVARNNQHLQSENALVLRVADVSPPLETNVKVLCHGLQTAITDNTNIYSADPSLGQIVGAPQHY